MNAVASSITPPDHLKRTCCRCGRRHLASTMRKRRTPAGGATYTCRPCDSRPRGKR